MQSVLAVNSYTMNKVQDSFPVEVSDDDVLYQPISHCTLCDLNYPDDPSLSRHLQTYHIADAFRCVACVDSVSLFPSYAAAAGHSQQSAPCQLRGSYPVIHPTAMPSGEVQVQALH